MTDTQDAKQTQVLDAIRSERVYQDMMIEAGRPDMRPVLPIGSSILAMEHNLMKARMAWYNDHGDYAATMECLRKVAGLIVQIGEVHGMPERDILEYSMAKLAKDQDQ